MRRSLSASHTLVRDFISNSLYHPTTGYFSSNKEIISSPPPNIDFTCLRNQSEYLSLVSAMYRRLPHSWMTPVELFQPQYSYALANYIVETHREKNSTDLCIFEIGGGLGTTADNILTYIRTNHNDLYGRTKYNIIEISQNLSLKQYSRLNESHPGRVTVDNWSIIEWDRSIDSECFVIAMEVIDNMPHDKLVLSAEHGLMETWIRKAGTSSYTEQYLPVQDDLIKRYLAASQDSKPRIKLNWEKSMDFVRSKLPTVSSMLGIDIIRAEFVPTVCFQFFETISRFMPHHRLILADFDRLPDTIDDDVRNAPVVQEKCSTSSGTFETKTHSTYMVPQGSCDILFPTDWNSLRDLYSAVTGRNRRQVRSMKQSQFLSKYSDSSRFKLKSGYNPLLQDYSNMSFLLS